MQTITIDEQFERLYSGVYQRIAAKYDLDNMPWGKRALLAHLDKVTRRYLRIYHGIQD
jgi:hypothetical protein